MSFYTEPTWWAVIAAGASAVFTWKAAKSAAHNARITKADALVCRVDLRLEPGHDNEAATKQGRRHGILTNHGEEVAFNVRLISDCSDITFEEFNEGTLNRGQSIRFEFSPPDPYPTLPQGAATKLNRPLSHYLDFEFQRPEGLGGGTEKRSIRYEDHFQGYKGDKVPEEA